MAIIQLITAILACYRLAQLLPDDDGPFFVFTRIRSFVATKAMQENDDLGHWANLDAGINCVYCCGLYAAFLVAFLVVWNNYYGNLFLLVMAIAGGQTLTQKVSK
jgi:hypothetical protein